MKSRRPGRTLLDLVVITGVVGALLALALVGLSHSREAMRRNTCSRNLQELGIGLQRYHQAFGQLPPAAIRVRPGELVELRNTTSAAVHYAMPYLQANWAVLLAPYIGHNELADTFDKSGLITDPQNAKLREADIPLMRCPADLYNRPDNMYQLVTATGLESSFARGNYAINGGVSSNEARPGYSGKPIANGFERRYVARDSGTVEQTWGNGIAGFNKTFAVQEFENGHSHLVAIEELRAGLLPDDSRGVWALGEIGSSVTYWHGLLGDASGPNSKKPRADDILGCFQLHKIFDEDGLVQEGMPCCPYTVIAGQATARSMHPGGVNTLLVDGSTKFFSDGCDLSVWHAMHSRDWREIADPSETGMAPHPVSGEEVASRPAAQSLVRPSPSTNSVDMELVWIAPGEFIMGLPDEGQDLDSLITGVPPEAPAHPVRVTAGFYIGRYEVTQGQYLRVVGTNPSWHTADGGGRIEVIDKDSSQFPVEQVTWLEAADFCNRLSDLPAERAAGRRYRLPTEVEWEYCCRSGSTVPFRVPALPSVDGFNILVHPQKSLPLNEVGSYEPNAFGLYDMRGNVWEWCADWYAPDSYARSAPDDPRGPASGVLKVVRNADWQFTAMGCKYGDIHTEPWRKNPYIGFRVLCEVAN